MNTARSWLRSFINRSSVGLRKRPPCAGANLQRFEIEELEDRLLLTVPEIAFWDFNDANGTTFKSAAITGTQAGDIEWRLNSAAVNTASGNLEAVDDGSNQFFTDLQQKSNTANFNPLDLTGKTQLRLEVNYNSWDLTNADDGAVQRFDLKRKSGTEYAFIRLRKTATGSEILLGFNGQTTTVALPTISGAVATSLELDLIANVATYDVGGTQGTINPANPAIALTNETLNFGVFNRFLGATSSSDTVVIDSMGLSAIPRVTNSVQSGDWTDPNTWDNGLPDDVSRAIVSPGTTITLDGTDHVAAGLVIHGILDVAEDGSTRTLTSDWIHVNSGGVFQVGTAADRFDNGEFIVTLTGTDVTADHVVETATGTINVTDNDGFLMTAANGRLQFFGEDEVTFTKLAATAEIGATTITVANIIERNFDGTTSAASDSEINWQIGDEIVIASSSRDYAHEEVRTITAVNNIGTETTFTLNAALNRRHYGEIETYDNGTRTWDIDLRAEVALLNRSITIQGTQDTDVAFGDRANYGTGAGQNLGIGGHTMIMAGSGQNTVDGVRFDRMGQAGQLGRYPIHWHLAGDRTGDVLRNSSVTNSNNRGATVHGTHGLLLEGNVFHDIHGHGFFMEDGVETENRYLNNIVLGIHKVGGDNSALSDPFIVDTHDVVFQDDTKELSSAAYWITNPDNVWIGNISAGSEGTGFWFILPTKAIGASAGNSIYDETDASTTAIDTFIHNSTHASPLGLVIDRGADIELGIGDPIFPGNGENAGRYFPPAPLFMQHFTAYKHGGAAIYTNVDDGYTFDEFRYADNFLSSFQLRSKTNSNTLYVGHSRGNADTSEVVSGHTLYNGNVILADNHYAGFTGPNGYFFSAEFASKRQHYLVSGASFENDGTANQISFDNPNGGALFRSQLPLAGIDVDGSLTGHVGGGPGYTIIPNHPFHQDGNDFVPAGWDALVTDDYYAAFQLANIVGLSGQIVETRITNPAGVSLVTFPGQNQLTAAIKLGWGDYSVEFHQGLGAFATEGFRLAFRMSQGDEFVPSNEKASVFQFKGIGGQLAPAGIPRVTGLDALRNATETVYFDDANGDLWMNIHYDQSLDLFGNTMRFLPVLTVDIDTALISENGGIATGTVTRPTDNTNALTVNLNSSDTGEAIVPATVTIPAGQSSVDFTVTAVNDNMIDATQIATVTASHFAHSSGTIDVSVEDSLAHRMSDLTVRVEDQFGNPIPGATIDVELTDHAFKFGTQVRDRFFSITQPEFDGLSQEGKQALLPNLLTQFGIPRYTPVWQDVVNYRDAVFANFNHVVPTTGLQWLALNNSGPTVPDAAVNLAQGQGLTATGASVVWQRDRWPTPVEFRPESNPDPQAFHDALIADRLSATGVLARYSDSGAGPTINDWKVLNEPVHEHYFADTFVTGGIYSSNIAAMADYFIRADALRPNATLSINEFNILNSGNDDATIEYRDLVNSLLAAGAPIDRIGIQAHMVRNDVTRADMKRRLDILAGTGLTIEISEFDTRDDAGQLTVVEQERIFRDLLEVTFEHPSVDGFIMWGFWDPGHWRGNGPLFDQAWNVKAEAAPWFDLVQGDWKADLTNLTLNSSAEWTSPVGLFDGTYDLTATVNGQSQVLSGYELTADGTVVLTIDSPAALVSQGVAYGNSTAAYGEDTIDPNKVALLPGEVSSLANFTNYTRGLNRVVIEVDSLPASALSELDDFEFRVGNTADPGEWLVLSGSSSIPLPAISITAGPTASVSRLILSWPDNEIENAWLQVTVNATANTGLASASTFYFGNQVGDVNGQVNIDNRIRVNAFDTGLIRLNQSPVNAVGMGNVYDIDRNGLVNSFDTGRVRLNQTLGGLLMFTAPANNPPSAPVAPPSGDSGDLLALSIQPSAVISPTTISQSQRAYLSRLITRWNNGFREDLSAERRRELTLRRLKRVAQRFANAATTFASTGDRRAARRDQMAVIVNSITEQIETSPDKSPTEIFDSWTNPVQ